MHDTEDPLSPEQSPQSKTAADERRRIRRLLHDTLTQSLFSAATLAGVAVETIEHNPILAKKVILELDSVIKDALAELKAIQAALKDEPTDPGRVN